MAGRDSYRDMLVSVAGEITEPEAEDLAQYLNISRADRLKISNGRKLIQEMEKIKFVTKDNVDNLLGVLREKKMEDAAERVEEYKHSLNGEDKSKKATIATGEQKGGTSARVDVKFFNELSKKLVREWKQVGRYLGLMEDDLECIQAGNSRPQEIVMAMLLEWWRKNGQGATYQMLADALDRAGRRDLKEETLQYATEH